MENERFKGFDLYSCENIRQCFAELYKHEVFIEDKTGVKTLEILNAQFVASQVSLFGVVDDSYLKKEVEWYDTMDQSIHAMEPPVPELWKSSASIDGGTNSNYGWAVYSPKNCSQFDHVLRELIANPYSRRAIMIYTRPSMQHEFNQFGKNDFMCTNNVQYFIRHNKLETLVSMRSNDAVFGYKCDRHWQMLVRDRLFSDLKKYHTHLSRGSIVWTVGSLHIYERHFYLVDGWLKTRIHDLTRAEYKSLTGI